MNIIVFLKSFFKQKKAELEELGIRHIYLFGSYSQGKQTEDSDIDLLIDANSDKLSWDIYGFFYNLEKQINKKIDIGFLDSLKPEIKKYLNTKDLIKLI